MSREIKVNRAGSDPLLSVEISFHPVRGGVVDMIRLSEVEMVQLAKALDLLCCDSDLLQVWRKNVESSR